MQQRKLMFLTATLFFLITLIGCTSSGSGSTDISSLSDIPSFNISEYDYSASSSTNSANKLTSLKGEAGEYSRAMCEGYALKEEGVRLGQSFEMFRCYIGTSDDNSDDLNLVDGETGHFKLIFSNDEPAENDENQGPPPEVHVRLIKNGNLINMDVCQGSPLTQSISLEIENSGDSIIGTLKEQFSGEYEGETFTEIMNTTSTLTPLGDDTYDAAVTGSFNGSHGSGILQFSADSTSLTNTINAAHIWNGDSMGTFESSMFAKWSQNDVGAVIGSASVAIESSYPAPSEDECTSWGVPTEFLSDCVNKCYDHQGNQVAADGNGMCPNDASFVESAQISSNGDQPTFTIIADDASDHFETAQAAILLDAADADPQAPSNWDCTGEFIEIDLTKVDFSACEELDQNEDLFGFCHEQEQAESSENN